MNLLEKCCLAITGMLFFAVWSCADNPGSSVPASPTLKISIKSISNANPTSSSKVMSKTAGALRTITSITITSVRVVIDKIELESSLGDLQDFELEEPFVQNLMAGSNTYEIATIDVAPGSYKELEIEIDELNPEDGAVYNVNPDLQGRSLFITGYLDAPDQTFEFFSDLEAEQEQEFNPPLLLDGSPPTQTSYNVVLTIDTDSWFVDGNGNLLDPHAPENQSIIEENIKNSFDVFEDKDDDGEKDEDKDEDDDD